MKKAFTLAEVLITLGIIGVVAAITLPTLIQNHQKRSLEVATQKFYSTMSQAVKKYMADEGVDDLRNTPLASDNYESGSSSEAIASIRNFITKYLKVIKECDPEKESCFAQNYKYWDGSTLGDMSGISWADDRDYILADGTIIKICYVGYKTDPAPIRLYVDVNGKKGPNRVGYDLWSMSIFYDGSIDEGQLTPECKKNGSACIDTDSSKEERQHRFEICKSENMYGGCFGHFLENNFKFDY